MLDQSCTTLVTIKGSEFPADPSIGISAVIWKQFAIVWSESHIVKLITSSFSIIGIYLSVIDDIVTTSSVVSSTSFVIVSVLSTVLPDFIFNTWPGYIQWGFEILSEFKL